MFEITWKPGSFSGHDIFVRDDALSSGVLRGLLGRRYDGVVSADDKQPIAEVLFLFPHAFNAKHNTIWPPPNEH